MLLQKVRRKSKREEHYHHGEELQADQRKGGVGRKQDVAERQGQQSREDSRRVGAEPDPFEEEGQVGTWPRQDVAALHQ